MNQQVRTADGFWFGYGVCVLLAIGQMITGKDPDAYIAAMIIVIAIGRRH